MSIEFAFRRSYVASLVLLVGVVALLAAFAMRGARPPDAAASAQKRQTGESREMSPAGQDRNRTALDDTCESLVKSLRTPGPAPTLPTRGADPVEPPVQIQKAIATLRANGVVAFPVLIRHLDDSAYSFSVNNGSSGPGYPNIYQVRSVCREIVESEVWDLGPAYKLRQGANGQEADYEGYFDAHDMKEWWRTRQTKTLRELRAEVIAWCIEREKRIGFATPTDEGIYLKPLLELQATLQRDAPSESPPVSGVYTPRGR